MLVRRGNTTLTVTGQVKDGNVTVNVNGAPPTSNGRRRGKDISDHADSVALKHVIAI